MAMRHTKILAALAVGTQLAIALRVISVIRYVVLPTVWAEILIGLELQIRVAFGVHVKVAPARSAAHIMDYGESQDKLLH